MTRRERIEIERRARRLKRIGFIVCTALIVGACGKATLSRSPDEVTEPVGDDTTPVTTEESAETKTVTRAGIVKPVKVDLYGEGTHYLENESGEFDILLVSSAIDLTQFEDQMTELSGVLRAVTGDPDVQILVVSGLASVSEHMNQDAVAAVKRLADPTYGFTDADTYTLVHSSASAGTAVVQIEHAGTTYHAKLVRRPDPITGEWEIYELSEGAYSVTSGSEEVPPASEDDGQPDPTTPAETSATTVGAGDIRSEVAVREGYATYEEPFAGYSIQFPKAWLYWAVGEAQTAEGKPVSSRIMFSDQEVEYENVLISIDIAPRGITETLAGYYADQTSEQKISIRGLSATKRTYSTSHVRVFVPRDAGSTFIISAIPREGTVRTDVLEVMLATLRLTFPG